jgi:hypothetical protein
MGWWRIEGPSGRIEWSSRGENGAVLENHIPGKNSPENYYNGDEPADVLDKVIGGMLDRLTNPAYKEAARNAFLGAPVDAETIDLIHKQSLEVARQKIFRVYKREWQREPYDEELLGLFEFCTAFIEQKSEAVGS